MLKEANMGFLGEWFQKGQRKHHELRKYSAKVAFAAVRFDVQRKLLKHVCMCVCMCVCRINYLHPLERT